MHKTEPIRNPTVAKEKFVANLNLDQLRPIFPLKLMTTLALDESTLGDTVREVAGQMGIGVRPDPEPERGLLRRSTMVGGARASVGTTSVVTASAVTTAKVAAEGPGLLPEARPVLQVLLLAG